MIEGAAEGAGLGVQFLRHLSRTHFLLHLVDIMPVDGSSPLEGIRAIVGELEKYSDELAAKPRWLVFNKIDLLPREESDAIIQDVVKALEWRGPVYAISAVDGEGTKQLCFDIMRAISE